MTMKSKIRKLLVIFVAMLFATSLYAGDTDRIGTAGGAQVLVPVGAQGIALGGANLATTKSVEAIYWNPAGLSRMEHGATGHFSTLTIFNDININYFAIGFDLGAWGALGLSIKAFDFGDIPLTTSQDMDGSSGQTFSPTFSTTALTYALNLTDNINVGINSKLVFESIPRAEANTVAFDIGLQYSSFAGFDGVSFGIAIKNIGGDMQYTGSGLTDQFQGEGGRLDYLSRDASANELPGTFEIGVSYKYVLNEENHVNASTMFQNNNYSQDAFKFGAEYMWRDMIAVRGGYNYVADIDAENNLYTFSLGAGLIYNIGGTDLTIDYAFRDSQYFDGNNIFGLTIGF